MDSKIIFVVGNSRSGTTMLSRILGRSSGAFALEELHFFEQIWQPVTPAPAIDRAAAENYIARLITIQREGYFASVSHEKYRSEATQVVARQPLTEWTPPQAYAAFVLYEAGLHGKSIPVEQTPRNLYYSNLILEFFPQACIVNIVRDPRAVLFSQKNRWRRRGFSRNKNVPFFQQVRAWVNYHPITSSLMWNAGLKAYRAVAQHPRVISLRFEDLLSNPEAEVRRLCDFAGLDYSADMLNVPQVGSSLRPDSPKTIGVDKSAADRWHGMLDTTELWLCQKITNPQIEQNGYRMTDVKPNPIRLLFDSMGFVFKSMIAFLINLRRARNPIQAVLHRLGMKS